MIKKIIRDTRNIGLHSIGLLTYRNRMSPDFLIIGAQKGGTSSLFYYLKFHPQIVRPIKKEIHYFNLFYAKGIKWYLAHFPTRSNGKITGEASPDYLYHPLTAQRVKALNPEMKLIVLLRNPIKRAYSAYQMNKRMGIDQRETFAAAVKYEMSHPDNGSADYTYDQHNFFYLERGKYAQQLATWTEHFDTDQIHVVESDTFFNHTNEELHKIYDFLGIKQVLPDNLKPMNVGQYPPLTDSLYLSLKQYFEQDLADLKHKWNIEIDI